jgi:hypothetical protein
MKAHAITPDGITLPLPAFVLHPLTALGLSVLLMRRQSSSRPNQVA